MCDIFKKLPIKCIFNIYIKITGFLEKYIFSFVVFFMRFWIARIFWYSGVQKFYNWNSTLALFKYEYRVPFIPSDIAAFLAASAELTIPPLLVIGLANRLAAIPLLIMTMVIQFTYLDLIDHLYWALLLCTIIFYGPGRYSLDHIIKNRCNNLTATIRS